MYRAFSYTANSNSARESWPEMEVPPAGTLPIEEWYVTFTLTKGTTLYLQYTDWATDTEETSTVTTGAPFLALKSGISSLMLQFVESCQVANQTPDCRRHSRWLTSWRVPFYTIRVNNFLKEEPRSYLASNLSS